MQRSIEASTTIPVPFATACAQLRSQPEAIVGSGRDVVATGRRVHGSVVVPLGVGTTVEQSVTLELGPVEVDGSEAGAAVEWAPDRHQRLLPSFAGRLLLAADGEASTVLQLQGTYHVPLGAAGRFGDAVVGRRIARASITELLERIGRRLHERHTAALDHRPPTPTPYNVDLRERAQPAAGGRTTWPIERRPGLGDHTQS